MEHLTKPHKPRTGMLYRREDETGISGTGSVAWAVEFPDGRVVLQWTRGPEPRLPALYFSLAHMLRIHGHGGKTVVIWDE